MRFLDWAKESCQSASTLPTANAKALRVRLAVRFDSHTFICGGFIRVADKHDSVGSHAASRGYRLKHGLRCYNECRADWLMRFDTGQWRVGTCEKSDRRAASAEQMETRQFPRQCRGNETRVFRCPFDVAMACNANTACPRKTRPPSVRTTPRMRNTSEHASNDRAWQRETVCRARMPERAGTPFHREQLEKREEHDRRADERHQQPADAPHSRMPAPLKPLHG